MRFKWSFGRSAAALGVCLVFLTLGAGLNAAQASTLTTLHVFCSNGTCTDWWHPTGSLLRDGAGRLFGTTEVGGVDACENECGVLYSMTPENKRWRFKVVYNFCKSGNCKYGANPHGGLIADAAGHLYGVMNSGTAQSAGGIFRVSSSGKHFKVLHSFCSEQNCQDGKAELNTGVALTYAGAASGAASDGVSPLYGVTEEGGANNAGVIFALAPQSDGKGWTYSVLYAFCSLAKCADGSGPAALIADAAGNLYGTASIGGGNNNDQQGIGGGAVFKFAGGSYQKIYSFCAKADCSDGEYPDGLTMDAQGNLIGVTATGGNANFGTIFKFDAAGVRTKLYDFCSQANCTDGATPTAAPFVDAAGNLFGVSTRGGTYNDGAIYKFDGAMHPLYSFCSVAPCGDGGIPYNPMIADSAGNFYGVTYSGGANIASGFGTVYEFRP